MSKITARRLEEETLKVEMVELAIREVRKLARKLDRLDIWGGSMLDDVAMELKMSIARQKQLLANWKVYLASQKRRKS